MGRYIQRETYLRQLMDRMGNGEVKIITGPRRSGKSWLLNRIFKDYLLEQGVAEDNIIIVSFDMDDDEETGDLTDRQALKSYLYSRITDDTTPYYIILDEVQEVEGFEKLVNGLNARDNVDVYITGSNSHFLSSDIKTIFRGRGDEVKVWPFSFREFCTDRTEPVSELWKEYYTYGGMPGLLRQRTSEQKVAYLQRLWNKTYLDDVVERHKVKNREALSALADALCSSVGSLTNPNRISNVMRSVQNTKIDSETVSNYIGYLEEAFLFEGAKRYNIKGNKYFESIKKYYSVDVGLRNAKLNFRQQEITHIMENVIYNELRMRGFAVDVGVVEAREMRNGKSEYIQYEIDFIASNGRDKYYIQSAFSLDSEEKRQQELRSLLKVDDSFQKIVITGSDIAAYTDNKGIRFMGLFQFLLSGI
ncbi:ATP-binding protein [Sodaliphilus pleomorphus]|jgi:predicted AAA+ superfamily ATPase|uniref:ATP-binding protein n=1 Tax=Sodaliphilus pleomorphus TaxID=2606626 RepID=A0A6L5XEW6_9BACT|nr:ATP-binding protein [Sodaliphilus pleomorphus]MSS17382.1 ATP-binding protein [Sodaliphilus pleomorphus]